MLRINQILLAAIFAMPALGRAEGPASQPAHAPALLPPGVYLKPTRPAEPGPGFFRSLLEPTTMSGPVGIVINRAIDSTPREKGAFLGVSVSTPPPVLRHQLTLPAGMGLVVDFVLPGSPAAEAGLQPFDIMDKLDDQLLVNTQQFLVLVRSHKIGNEVKLSVIRDGKSMMLTAKLGEHEIEPVPEERQGFLIDPAHPELSGKPPLPFQNPAAGPMTTHSSASFTLFEGDHAFAITVSPDGHRTFSVRDTAGKTSEEYKIDTQEEKDKVPATLKPKLDMLEKTAANLRIESHAWSSPPELKE